MGLGPSEGIALTDETELSTGMVGQVDPISLCGGPPYRALFDNRPMVAGGQYATQGPEVLHTMGLHRQGASIRHIIVLTVCAEALTC